MSQVEPARREYVVLGSKKPENAEVRRAGRLVFVETSRDAFQAGRNVHVTACRLGSPDRHSGPLSDLPHLRDAVLIGQSKWALPLAKDLAERGVFVRLRETAEGERPTLEMIQQAQDVDPRNLDRTAAATGDEAPSSVTPVPDVPAIDGEAEAHCVGTEGELPRMPPASASSVEESQSATPTVAPAHAQPSQSGDARPNGLPTPDQKAFLHVAELPGFAVVSALSPSAAQDFLTHVFPGRTDPFVFQTFEDCKGGGWPKILYGTLAECWSDLERKSQEGSGLFFLPNISRSGGRRSEDIVATGGALAADLDGAPLNNLDRLPLKPHAVVETSPGRWHVWWRVDGVPLSGYTALMNRLAVLLAADKKVCDTGHVFRLPGSLHRKDPSKPHAVSWSRGEARGEPYTAANFEAALAEAEKARSIAPADEPRGGAPAGQGERCGIEEIKSLLDLIPNDYHFDDRDEWIKMAHAIHGASGGDAQARNFWIEWSNTRLQKSDEPERVWDTIAPKNVRAGAGTIREHARRADPGGYARLQFDGDGHAQDAADPHAATATPPGEAMAREVVREAMRGGGQTPALSTILATLDDVLAAGVHVAAPLEIVPNFVRSGEAHLITAAPGVGKSALMAHLAVCAARGTSPDGGAAKGRACHVIALFGEDAEHVVQDRLKAARDWIGLSAPEAPSFAVIANRPLSLAETDKDGRLSPEPAPGLIRLCDRLLAICERHRGEIAANAGRGTPVVLILDMLRHFAAVEKNSSKDANAVYAVLKALMTIFQDMGGPEIGVVFSMHDTKAAARKQSGGDFSTGGAIEWEGGARMVSRLSRDGDVLVQTVTKNNNGSTGIVGRWQFVSTPSRYPGVKETFRLEPITAQAAMVAASAASLVNELHRWMIANPVKVVSTAKNPRPPVLSVADVVADWPDGNLIDAATIKRALDQGLAAGAFSKERFQDPANKIDIDTKLVPDPNWRPSIFDAEDDDCDGESNSGADRVEHIRDSSRRHA